MDARPSGGGAEEIFGCNEKVGVPEFLTGTSPGGLGIARTPERTSPIRRPPLDTCGRAGRTPQPGSPAQCCVAGRSGHFLGRFIIFWAPTVTNRKNFIFADSCVSTKPKRRCLGKRSPPRRHPQPPAVDIIRTILAKRSQSQTHTHYNMTTIDFGSSGQRLDVTLEDVAAMALLYGFERPGPHAPTKPTSQRANLSDFFNVYGVNAFSKFKDKFRRETLLPPEEQKAKQEQKVSGSQNCRCALLDRMTQSDRLPIFPGNR